MIVGRLKISFDRGVVRNAATDVGLDIEPEETPQGGIVRGLGTHFVSAEAREKAKMYATEDRKIRVAFQRAFMLSPVPGIYVLGRRDAGAELIATLTIPPGMEVRVAVYDLAPAIGEGLPAPEVQEWVDRVRGQMNAAPLGRGGAAAQEGLDVLQKLATCPVLSERARQRIGELIQDARLEKITRIDFKRAISEMPLELECGPTVAPRRAPVAKHEEPEAGAA